MPDKTIARFEKIIHRDPAQRGLISSESNCGPLFSGHLAAAASHLASHAHSVAILTGFYVPHGQPPAAETDGPPGALVLAQTLERLGIPTQILTDRFCQDAVLTTAQSHRYPISNVVTFPDNASEWIESYFQNGFGKSLSHLISVERAGPSHSGDSVQIGTLSSELRKEFLTQCPQQSWNRCHNMRGDVIDQYAGTIHSMFEVLPQFCPHAVSIGIGDGGNEIGMGNAPWFDLHARLPMKHRGKIPCRIATDWTIIGGTSNWGALALSAALAAIRQQVAILGDFDTDQQQAALKHLVSSGPAVDGITGQQQPTVDGLPFTTYIQPWQAIRKILGLSE